MVLVVVFIEAGGAGGIVKLVFPVWLNSLLLLLFKEFVVVTIPLCFNAFNISNWEATISRCLVNFIRISCILLFRDNPNCIFPLLLFNDDDDTGNDLDITIFSALVILLIDWSITEEDKEFELAIGVDTFDDADPVPVIFVVIEGGIKFDDDDDKLELLFVLFTLLLATSLQNYID